MAVGLTIAILGVGLVDKLTLGDWFHSPLACFRANIEEGIAAKYGVYPFARYFTWARGNLLHISPFVFPLLLLGAFREPRLAFIAFLGVLGHSFIAHKEYRFIWPVLPLFFLMIALGFEMAYTWLGRGWHRQYLVTHRRAEPSDRRRLAIVGNPVEPGSRPVQLARPGEARTLAGGHGRGALRNRRVRLGELFLPAAQHSASDRAQSPE